MDNPTTVEKPEDERRAICNVLVGAGSLEKFTLPELARFCRNWPGVDEKSAGAVLDQHPELFEKDAEGAFNLRPGARPALRQTLEDLHLPKRGLNVFSRK